MFIVFQLQKLGVRKEMREEEMHVFLHTNDGSYIKLVATQPHWSFLFVCGWQLGTRLNCIIFKLISEFFLSVYAATN